MNALKIQIIAYLKKHVNSARYKHTIGTCGLVEELAEKYGLPRAKATITALLHDAGKGFSKTEMVRYAAKRGLQVPYKELVIKHNPSLLHSHISADIAKRMFGVKDKGILAAIASHTVGAENMSMLSKIMYVADSVSPDRRYPGVKELRALAFRDIDAAALGAMANKIYYVVKKRKWLHPGAVKAWNYMVDMTNRCADK